MKTKFSELTSIEAINILKELGDGEAVHELTALIDEKPELRNTRVSALPEEVELANAKWRGTEHTYGYIEMPADNPGDFLDIRFASTIPPDDSLRNQLINIKLGSLYTMNYPGGGRHNVLMHFRCKQPKPDAAEPVLIEFEQKFKSKEKEGAGNIGDFIFIGVKVPANGLQIEVQTINVSNDGDEEALRVLESDTIKNGLDLVNATFASIAPLTQMAKGVLGLVLSRNRNKVVQQFTMGFDFDAAAIDIPKLRLGTYVVVQAKKNEMPWTDWVYQRSKGLVVNRNDHAIRLPYNHLTFNVLRYSNG